MMGCLRGAAKEGVGRLRRMHRTVLACALWIGVAVPSARVDAGAPDIVYRLVRDDGTPGDAADVKSSVAVLTNRLAALGFKSVVVAATEQPGQIGLSVPSELDGSFDRVRRLVERRGALEFRIKADDGLERMWRNRRRPGVGGSPLQPPHVRVNRDDPPPELTW
jgi:hypothetical protein